MTALTVVIADDQPVVLAGLQTMLDAEGDISVVGAAGDGLAAVALAAELRPDVVLMDIRMPGIDGIEAARRIVDAQTAGAVLMITTFDDEEYLLDSVRAGASGFLLKNAGADLLATAVRSASRGDALIDPAMTRALLERRLQRAGTGSSVDDRADRLASLSDREREVLAALARGLSNSEMARELFVSEATVKTHLVHVYEKLGASDRAAAVATAYERGILG